MGIKVDIQANVETQQVTSALNQLVSNWTTATSEMKEAVNKALGGTVEKKVEIQFVENSQGIKEAVAVEKERYTVLDNIVKLREKETKAMPGSLTSLRQQLNTATQLRDSVSQYVSIVENGVISGRSLNQNWVAANQNVLAIKGALDQAGNSTFFDRVGEVFNESGIAGFLRGVGNLVQGFQALAIVFQQITASFDTFVNAQKKIQGLELTFKSIGQGATGGAEALKAAADISNNLGVNLDTTINSFKQLTPVVLNSGGSMSDVAAITESLSSRFVAFGKSADESKRILNAVIQAFGKGKLQAEELNQQISEADPAFRTDLAEAIGVSVAALETMVKEGQITSEMLVDILPKMSKTGEIFKLSGMSAAEAAQALGQVDSAGRALGPTLEQVSSKIQTTNQLTLINLSGEFDKLIKAIFEIQGALADFFSSMAQNDIVKAFADVLGDVALGFAKIVEVTLGAIDVIASIFSGVGTLVSAFSDLEVAGVALGPVFGLFAAAGLTTVFAGWVAGAISTAKEMKALGTALLDSARAKAAAIAASKDAAIAETAELDALVAKQAAEKAATTSTTAETTAVQANTTAVSQNTAAIEANAAAKAAQATAGGGAAAGGAAGTVSTAANATAVSAVGTAAGTATPAVQALATAEGELTTALGANTGAANTAAGASAKLGTAQGATATATGGATTAVAANTAATTANAAATNAAGTASAGFMKHLKSLGTAIVGVGESIKAFLLSPMGLIIIAIAGVGAAVASYQASFKGAEEVTKGFGDSINEIDKSLQASGAEIKATKDAWDSTGETVGGFARALDLLPRALNNINGNVIFATQAQNYYANEIDAATKNMAKFESKMNDMDAQIQKDIQASDGSAQAKQKLTAEIDKQNEIYQKQISTNKSAILAMQQRQAGDKTEQELMQISIQQKQQQVQQMENEIAANERLKASLGLVTEEIKKQIEAQKARVDLAKAQEEAVTFQQQGVIDAAKKTWDDQKKALEEIKEKVEERYKTEKTRIDDLQRAETSRHNALKTNYDDQKIKIQETYDKEKAALDELKAKIEETYNAKIEKLRDPTASEAALKELQIAELQKQAASASTNEERLRARAQLERIEADKKAAELEKQQKAELAAVEAQQKALEKQKEAELAAIKKQERDEDKAHAATMERLAQEQVNLEKAKQAADTKYRNEQKKAAETYGPIIEAAEARIQEAKQKTQAEQLKLKNLEKDTGGEINNNIAAQNNHTTAIQNSANAVRTQLIKSYQDLGTTIKNLPKPPPAASLPPAFAGGPVNAGDMRMVNEIGREAFLSSSGKLSWINAPSFGAWKAPSSGTIIPAHIAAGLGIPSSGVSISRSSVRSVTNNNNSNNRYNDIAKLFGAIANSSSGPVTNNVTIQSQSPVKTASDMLVEMTKIKRRRYS